MMLYVFYYIPIGSIQLQPIEVHFFFVNLVE